MTNLSLKQVNDLIYYWPKRSDPTAEAFVRLSLGDEAFDEAIHELNRTHDLVLMDLGGTLMRFDDDLVFVDGHEVDDWHSSYIINDHDFPKDLVKPFEAMAICSAEPIYESIYFIMAKLDGKWIDSRKLKSWHGSDLSYNLQDLDQERTLDDYADSFSSSLLKLIEEDD